MFSKYTNHFFLKYFGYVLLFGPFILIVPDVIIYLYSIGLILDQFPLLLPYKFCGILGEWIIIANKKTYGIVILIGVIYFSWIILRNKKKFDNIFDVLDEPINQSVNENQSVLVDKLMAKYSIKSEIKNVEIGNCFTRYYLNISKEVKFNRFISLSPDLSALLNLKVRACCDLQYCFLEIENKNKDRVFLKHFMYYSQPNKIFALDCKKPYLLDVKQNILIHASKSIIHSIICSLLITKIDIDILILGESDLSFMVYNSVVINSPETKIQEVINEMERRYRIIIPVADDIIQYNLNQKEKINYLVIILRISDALNPEIIRYIIQYGKKVGLFVILHDESKDKILPFIDIFSIIITSGVENKNDSISLLGISGAEYLNNPHDCIIKHSEMINRISIPIVSTDEASRIAKYLDNIKNR
jgi:hypothetical protein